MTPGVIVLAGGSGFLGRPLARALIERGHDVVVLSRGARSTPGGRPRTVRWTPDGGASGEWTSVVDGAAAVINLAGAGLADKRWTNARKDELLSSRVLSTRSLVTAVRNAARRPAVFIQGSGAGFYGLSDDRVFDESFPPGDDFLAFMATSWESEARPVEALGVRLVIVRTGVVLAKDGGALGKMVLPFKLFVGGPIASGRQYYSWIHRDDWIALVLWALERPDISGVLNATAPEPVTNRAFSTALGRTLHRPSLLPVPAFALRVMFGEMADVALIGGQRVVPKRAQDLGFQFRYPTVDRAMHAALRRPELARAGE